MIKILFFGFLCITFNLFSQNSYDKVFVDEVSLIYAPGQNDTCITEYSGDSNYKTGKIKKQFEFNEAVFSDSYHYYNKFSNIMVTKMREEIEKKIKAHSLIDTLKNNASYRPNDLSCRINITKFNILAVGYSYSLKHIYQIEANVTMLNKKGKEVYAYKESYQSNIRKVSNLVKIMNGVDGFRDFSKLDLLYDTIINESLQTILSKNHLDDFSKKKDSLKDFDPNAIVNETSNLQTNKETKKTNSEADSSVTEEKHPVFTQILLKSKNQKKIQDLSEAINSIVVVQVGESKCSGIIISDDGYILTSYAILNGDSSKSCEIIFPDGKKIVATKARINIYADLLLLKISGVNYTPLILNTTNEPKITNDIYAIGSSGSTDLGTSISKGIISGNRIIEKKPILQLNANINIWQIGGGLFTPKGDLIGMLYSKLTGNNVEGIGFALTNSYIIKSLNLKYE